MVKKHKKKKKKRITKVSLISSSLHLTGDLNLLLLFLFLSILYNVSHCTQSNWFFKSLAISRENISVCTRANVIIEEFIPTHIHIHIYIYVYWFQVDGFTTSIDRGCTNVTFEVSPYSAISSSVFFIHHQEKKKWQVAERLIDPRDLMIENIIKIEINEC